MTALPLPLPLPSSKSTLELLRNVCLSSISLGVSASALTNGNTRIDDDASLQELLRRATVLTTDALLLLDAASSAGDDARAIALRARTDVAALLAAVKALPRAGVDGVARLAPACAALGSVLRELSDVLCASPAPVAVEQLSTMRATPSARLSGCAADARDWSRHDLVRVTHTDQLPPSVLAALHVAGLSSMQIDANIAHVLNALAYDESEPLPPTVNDGCAPSFVLSESESQLVFDKYVFLGAAGVVRSPLLCCLFRIDGCVRSVL